MVFTFHTATNFPIVPFYGLIGVFSLDTQLKALFICSTVAMGKRVLRSQQQVPKYVFQAQNLQVSWRLLLCFFVASQDPRALISGGARVFLFVCLFSACSFTLLYSVAPKAHRSCAHPGNHALSTSPRHVPAFHYGLCTCLDLSLLLEELGRWKLIHVLVILVESDEKKMS